ncbi:MAG: hypothetical protein ACFFE4_14245 [Candidatus Thorarchaeota archaeon]
MVKEVQNVSFTDAKTQVEVAVTRIALLHLAFSRTLVEQLGQEKGKELILKSIMEYGKIIGERTIQHKQDLPKYGVHEKFEGGKVYGCIFCKYIIYTLIVLSSSYFFFQINFFDNIMTY